MKKSCVFLIVSLIATIASSAAAQQIIVVPSCTGYCGSAPEQIPAPAQNYTAPHPMVPAAPQMVQEPMAPLRRLGLHAFAVHGTDEYGEMGGGGVAISYMFTKYWGIQAGVSILSEDNMQNNRVFFRSQISALWFPSGVKNSGLSLYLKGGIMNQDIEQAIADAGAVPMNNSDDGEEYGYYEDKGPTGSGTTIVLGGGLQWRVLSGHMSFSLEATLVGPAETDQTGETGVSTSPSINLAFISSLHF